MAAATSAVEKSNERDHSGRFVPGHRGLTPHGTRSGQLRRAILECVTPEGVESVLSVLHTRALAGDVTAARIYLDRGLGPPKDPAEYDDPADLLTLMRQQLDELPIQYVQRMEEAYRDGLRAIGKTPPPPRYAGMSQAEHERQATARREADEDRKSREDKGLDLPG